MQFAKEEIFCQNFRNVFVISSSVARMRERGKKITEVEREAQKREREKI